MQEPTDREIKGYSKSRDYALLAKLMREQSVICMVDDGYFHDIACTRFSNGKNTLFEIWSLWKTYVCEYDEQEFIEECTKCNVEFILPDKAK